MKDYTAYLNGKWVPFSTVKVDPMDRGFLVGDVVFDVARTFNGKAFRLKQHIDRLYRSLNYVRIDPGLSPQEMIDISEETVKRNEPNRPKFGEFTIWQIVTRGPGTAADAGPPMVCIKLSDVNFHRFAHLYESGAHGVITRTKSYSAQSLDPKIKHFSRMNFNMADLEAADVDPEAYPILTDMDGFLTEGTGNNIFLVTNGVIRTPMDNAILQGVSRGMVIDLAHQLDLPLVEENLQPYDLYTADEAFITGSSPSVLPMTRVDMRTIGNGLPGPVTRQLIAAWGESVGVDIVGQALNAVKAKA